MSVSDQTSRPNTSMAPTSSSSKDLIAAWEQYNKTVDNARNVCNEAVNEAREAFVKVLSAEANKSLLLPSVDRQSVCTPITSLAPPVKVTPSSQPTSDEPIHALFGQTGALLTEPKSKIVFNSQDKVCHVKLTNGSPRRFVWAIKTTDLGRFSSDPPCGVLDPKETDLMTLTCHFKDPIDINDRIVVEWINTPDGAAKQFRRDYIFGAGKVRRRSLFVEYNP